MKMQVIFTINLVPNNHGLRKMHVVWAYPPSIRINFCNLFSSKSRDCLANLKFRRVVQCKSVTSGHRSTHMLLHKIENV